MKKLQTLKINNSGATAIMFAMFFVIIISLITIGFATLVRRDQRATLDKTLSAQAQLLAESGVNSVKQYLYNSTTPASNPDCVPTTPGYVMPTFTDANDRISCVTWNNTPTESAFTLKPYESYSFNQKNHTGWTKLRWSTYGVADNAYYGEAPNGTLPRSNNQIPPIASSKKSIIKVVTVSRAQIYAVPSKVQVFYLVPFNGGDVVPSTVTPGGGDYGTDYVDLGNAGYGGKTTESANGLVYYIPCSGTECSVTIAGYSCPDVQPPPPLGNPELCDFTSGYGDRMFYFMPMGTNETAIKYQSIDGDDGPAQPLDGIQVAIDVTAISQDQTKRLIAYVPVKSETDVWKPFYGALSDRLCKDIKIDGLNSLGVQQPASVCP